jgi:hypothetical protein
MLYHLLTYDKLIDTLSQINADGAGPLRAAIDPTSCGTDASAFQDAEVTQDVPGFLGFGRVTVRSPSPSHSRSFFPLSSILTCFR